MSPSASRYCSDRRDDASAPGRDRRTVSTCSCKPAKVAKCSRGVMVVVAPSSECPVMLSFVFIAVVVADDTACAVAVAAADKGGSA